MLVGEAEQKRKQCEKKGVNVQRIRVLTGGRFCRAVPMDAERTWGWCVSINHRSHIPWSIIPQSSGRIRLMGHQTPEGVGNLHLHPIILLCSLS